MKITIGMLILISALTACSGQAEKISFDGQFFKTDLDELDARHKFQATASPVSSSLLGAKEAVRYEATVFCVNEYGSSDIKWVVGPDDPDEAVPIANDTLTLQGECSQ